MKPPTTIREPSAWLRGAAGGRLKQIKAMGVSTTGPMIVTAPLGRPAKPGSVEDRTCDRCRLYVPQGPLFYPITYRAAPYVVLVGGLCEQCKSKEGNA